MFWGSWGMALRWEVGVSGRAHLSFGTLGSVWVLCSQDGTKGASGLCGEPIGLWHCTERELEW